MAGPGRPRKPTALKKLKGTLQPCRTNQNEWVPPAGAPPMPEYLDSRAQELWKSKILHLECAGIVSQVDGEALAAWCQAVSRAVEADAIVRAEGLTAPTQTGITTHPAVRISRASWDAAAKLGAMFGFDPSSRSKISAAKVVDADPLEDFLAGKDKRLSVVK